LDLASHSQFVGIAYFSDRLESLVIDCSLGVAHLGVAQWMAATVQVAPPGGLPAFHLCDAVTIDYVRYSVPKLAIGPLCYNGSQRYCHGLLVTR
jgi:hypothetical protein